MKYVLLFLFIHFLDIMLNTYTFPYSVLLGSHDLSDRSKIKLDRASRVLQLPTHLSKLKTNGYQRSLC